MALVALRSKEAFWLEHSQFYGHFQSYHLLVRDEGDKDVIPKSIQLAAGRTGQEYNQRKNRKGAYWENRYHATAVETGEHLVQCSVYIDLNMVRAGVLTHPDEWPLGGYMEIQELKKSYALIDYDGLMEVFGFGNLDDFAPSYRGWSDGEIQKENLHRDRKWTENIVVGSESFVKKTKKLPGSKGTFELKEATIPYNSVFRHENEVLSTQNRYFWEGFS